MENACGKRLLQDVIDHKANVCPSQVWLRYFEDWDSLQRGKTCDITFGELAGAINRLTRHLESNVDNAGATLCYIGPSDARYFIFALAAAHCGRKALFSSPKNNVSAHMALIQSTNCQDLFTPVEGFQHGIPDDTLKLSRVRCSTIPSLRDLLSQGAERHIGKSKSFDEVAHETFMYLHTSGSTGEPKAVAITNGLIATMDAQQLLPPVDGRYVTAREWKSQTVYSALPPFHSAGINFLAYSIFQDTRIILGPSDTTPSTTVLRRMLDLNVAEAGLLAPSILVDAAAEEDLLKSMGRWSSVGFGGAPLPDSVGNKIWQHVRICQLLGSTETNNIPELPPQSEDEWAYHNYHPGLGIQWRHHAENLWEMIFIRDESIAQHQGAFWTFPDRQEYSMKDLYAKHPTKEGLWMYKGRVDDTIVLENGEKFNPKAAELLISGHSDITSALIVGSQKPQAALFIEPKECASKLCMDSVWETVQEANKVLPRHAQIAKEYIKVVDKGAFSKSAKGEVRRAVTERELADTTARLYQSVAEGESGSESSDIDFSTQEGLTKSLVRLLQQDFGLGNSVSTSSSLIHLGLDSLQISQLARKLKIAMKSQEPEAATFISPRTVYDSKNVEKLAASLLALLSEVSDSDSGVKRSITTTGENNMQTTLEVFMNKIKNLPASPKPQTRNRRRRETPAVVLITGSTGSLGSRVLKSLASKKPGTISKIICVNRPKGSSRRQSLAPHSAGSILIETIEADLSTPNTLPARLLAQVTHILHIAWPVNFEFPLSQFRPQLETCLNLIATNKPITFISSIGAANRWAQGPVPEKILYDLGVSEDMGYAQSKQLAELMFNRAAEVLGTDVKVVRVGQITGPVKDEGVWNPTEWFPRLMQSSREIRQLPKTLGMMERIDWIPVDEVADILADVILTKDRRRGGLFAYLASCLPFGMRKKAARVLHLTNPTSTLWSSIAPRIANGLDLKLVSYSEWLEKIEGPALALEDFYQEIGREGSRRPVFSTKESQKFCPGLRRLEAVSAEWVELWIKQWEATGEM